MASRFTEVIPNRPGERVSLVWTHTHPSRAAHHTDPQLAMRDAAPEGGLLRLYRSCLLYSLTHTGRASKQRRTPAALLSIYVALRQQSRPRHLDCTVLDMPCTRVPSQTKTLDAPYRRASRVACVATVGQTLQLVLVAVALCRLVLKARVNSVQHAGPPRQLCRPRPAACHILRVPSIRTQ